MITPVPKPLLASEVLAAEHAPIQPAAASARLWLLAVAGALCVLGVALREGMGVPSTRFGGANIAFSAAGAVVALALLPFPYALRGAVSLLVGSVLVAVGLRGSGPLSGLIVDGSEAQSFARLVVVATLPAALLLRRFYPLARQARWILAAAWLAAVPFLWLQGLLVADSVAPVVSRVGGAVSIAVILCCLFAFMPESSGGSSVWAALVLLGMPAGFGLRDATPLAGADTGLLTYAATGWGLLCAAALVTLGAFQLLAAVLGPRARADLGKKRGTNPSVTLNVVPK